ncbi:DndE family protein [Sulfurimonas indica]|uniref:DndE family protein n=1 Tax=Sulfurimonas indica TaxID=2508707 RepID=UPI001265101B|nr:DndE family protein [Sulfurimonas indica]
MRTTEHTEQHLSRIARLLGFENDPKWLTIRFAISISLALEEKINMKEKIDFSNGKTYNLEVITGKGKLDLTGDQADYNDLMALIIANVEEKQIKTEREFEKALEFHCERGFNILTSSLRDNSDIFGWIKQEFLTLPLYP